MIKLGNVRYLEEPTVYLISGCNVRLKNFAARIRLPAIADVQAMP